MSIEAPRFLPERLRPRSLGRRSRRGLVAASVVPICLLALPLWRVSEVRVDGGSRLPPAAVAALRDLAGQPAFGLDLAAIRDRVRAWPGVGEVQVELELPGTLVVRAEEAPTLGSMRVGQGWHGVGADGRLTGVVQLPVGPLLAGFASDVERSRALAVAQRLAAATGARVLELRRITPYDFEARLTAADEGPTAVVRVQPQPTTAELAWCAAFAAGTAAQGWADLRWPDRMVVGVGG